MTRKQATEFLWIVVIAIALFFLADYLIERSVINRIESEKSCESCESKNDWCEGFWEVKGRCGR